MKKGILYAGVLITLMAVAMYFYPAAMTSPTAAKNFNPPTHSDTQAASSKPAAHRDSSATQSSSDGGRAFDEWVAHIQTSTRPVDQIARVIYSKDVEKNIATLKALLEADPQNVLLHYLLAQNCLRKFDAAVCKSVRQSALATFAADNGIVSDMDFFEQYQQGNIAAALQALNDASHATHTDSFYGAEVSALDESMTAAGLKHDIPMLQAVTGIMAAEADSIYNNLMQTCKQRAQPEWQETCYARGVTLFERSANNYPKIIGMQIIKNTGRTDDPHYEQMRAQFKQHSAEVEEALPLWDSARASGLQFNDAQWQEFIVLSKTQGEESAKAYLVNVIKNSKP